MDTDIHTLQDLFKVSFEAFEECRAENAEIEDLYHNRQYTDSQLAVLARRGQPPETFNVIKLFGRLILGYYSTVVNSVKISPVQESDVTVASLLNDTVSYIMRRNHMETEGDKIKLDGILHGLMVAYEDVIPTGKKDQFGRPLYSVHVSHVPASEVLLDPMSRLEDYTDARYVHRWKWIAEDSLLELFPTKKAIIDKLTAYENHLNISDAEFERTYGVQFEGHYKRFNNYLIVHTIVKGNDGKWWSIYWCGDEILDKKEVTYKEVRNPYRVHKIHTSNKAEYYSIFRDVKESQHAINQALLKIQLMANSQKVFVEDGGVEDLTAFTDAVNRVNAIIPVRSLNKIRVENLTREIVDQYTVIDKAFDRIQRVLGVNDSFLGMAFASDSGRKVKLQQNATVTSLRYMTVRIEQFYRMLGWDIVNLVKQYYTAQQTLAIIDESVGKRWIELNKPMTMWTGKFDANQQPIMDYVWQEVLDPATNEPAKDDKGNYIIAPVPEYDTEIAFAEVDLDIDSVIYNDEDEKNQQMIETVLQGNIGANISSVNPAGFFKIAALAIKSMKMKHSIDISNVLDETAMIVGGKGNMLPDTIATLAGLQGPQGQQQAPGSTTLQIPKE